MSRNGHSRRDRHGHSHGHGHSDGDGHDDGHGDREDGALGAVLAKLNRRPQDELQAAVVLEAWAGRKPPECFSITPVVARRRGLTERAGPADPGIERRRRLADYAVVCLVVVAAMVWAPFLLTELGSQARTAVIVGMPLALAADGWLRTRYLGPGGLGGLSWLLPVVNGAVAAVVVGLLLHSLVTGSSASGLAVLVVSLAVVWGQASIVAVREWHPVFVLLLAAMTVGIATFEVDRLVLAFGAVAMLVLASVAAMTDDGPRFLPESASLGLAGSIIGACTGVLLVADGSLWFGRSVPAQVAVFAVTAGGWMGSLRLSRLWHELPERMALQAAGPWAMNGSDPVIRSAVRDATARVAVIAVPAMAFLAVTEPGDLGVVAAIAVFTVAMLVIGLTVAARHWLFSSVVMVVGSVVAAFTASDAVVDADMMPGLGLLVGSLLVLVASSIRAAATFQDTTAAFATRMMIR